MHGGLLERLDRGEVLLLDGAVGTELQRRGALMHPEVWCGLASTTHPDLLVAVHADYITAGAQIITTNTFATARHVLGPAGLADDVKELNTTAVLLARRAVEKAGIEGVVVAGSMSSMAPLSQWTEPPTGTAVAASYREQAGLLVEAGADVLIAEMMLDLENAVLVIEAAQETEVPLLVGWSASRGSDGTVATYRSDQIRPAESPSFNELMEAGTRLGGDVHGIMHSSIGVTGPALGVLREHWGGPTMAYAETGRFEPPNWVFTDEGRPETYAGTARSWVGEDVPIVGGCCGTTPEHIAAIHRTVRSGASGA